MAEFRRFPIAAMVAFTRDALLACGVPAADAELAAKQMIEAGLSAKDIAATVLAALLGAAAGAARA